MSQAKSEIRLSLEAARFVRVRLCQWARQENFVPR